MHTVYDFKYSVNDQERLKFFFFQARHRPLQLVKKSVHEYAGCRRWCVIFCHNGVIKSGQRRNAMFEIVMLTGFLAAAISQLLPESPQTGKPDHRKAKDHRSGQSVRKDPKKGGRSPRASTFRRRSSAGGKPGKTWIIMKFRGAIFCGPGIKCSPCTSGLRPREYRAEKPKIESPFVAPECRGPAASGCGWRCALGPGAKPRFDSSLVESSADSSLHGIFG